MLTGEEISGGVVVGVEKFEKVGSLQYNDELGDGTMDSGEEIISWSKLLNGKESSTEFR